jgi:transcriptional regulator with XRE-family HTH domain
MAKRLTRRTLGDKFSEGSRLLWEAVESRGLGITETARSMGIDAARVLRVMYGDREPDPKLITQIFDVFAIPADTWGRPPARDFVLPACRPEGATGTTGS